MTSFLLPFLGFLLLPGLATAAAFTPLGDLPGGDFASYAAAVSADGGKFIPTDVSGDGAIAVGLSETAAGDQRAVIWTSEGGPEPLIEFLAWNGATGLAGWTLTEASGISDDGVWVVGYGRNPDGFNEAFRANVRPLKASGGGGGAVDATCLLAFGLMAWRRRIRAATFPVLLLG